MNHSDRVNLLKNGVSQEGRVWAEFGSGTGAFTLALAELIDPHGTIFSVDLDSRSLNQQKRELQKRSPYLEVHYMTSDFTKALDLPLLDGILMANTLHFVKEKESFILQIKNYLKAEARLLIVEYNIDLGNRWVPRPISFDSWEALAKKCGFNQVHLLCIVPSMYHKEVYSAISFI